MAEGSPNCYILNPRGNVELQVDLQSGNAFLTLTREPSVRTRLIRPHRLVSETKDGKPVLVEWLWIDFGVCLDGLRLGREVRQWAGQKFQELGIPVINGAPPRYSV